MSIEKSAILERLNPADSFTLAMDEEIRRDGLAGSLACYGLELANIPDIDALRQRIDEFGRRFPVARASLRQIGKRFYWCKRSDPPELFFQHHCPTDADEAQFRHAMLDRIMNEKLPRESIAPLEFHLLTGPSENVFLMRWLHPFCDARGADLIIKYLCTADSDQRQRFGQLETGPLVFEQLRKYRWWQKISLLLKGKRYIDRLDRLSSIQPLRHEPPPQRLEFAIRRLSEEQTERVVKLARQQVGLTGTSLYYIGCLMRALDKWRPDNPGEAYCVPYAFNLRKQRALSPVCGNHLSALFAQAPREIVKDRRKLFEHLKQQNTQVIRQQEDYAFLPLMWAGSWLSLAEYGKVLRLSYGSGQERSSFWFSDIGRLDLPADSFPCAEITDVFHACQVTSPPSLAFLNCIFRNRLTLSYNYVEPIADAETIDALHRLMLTELLGETD